MQRTLHLRPPRRVGLQFPPAVPVMFPRPSVRRSPRASEENAVALAADLSVVDGGCCRIGDEPEAMPGALGCRRGDGNRDAPNLKEVPGKMVRRVMDTHEALCDAAPLEVNRIDPPARESKWPVRAKLLPTVKASNTAQM